MIFIVLQLLLLFIAYQDFKKKSVMAILLFGVIVVSFFYSLLTQKAFFLLINSIINLSITAFFILSLTVYFSLKERKRVNIFAKHFGIGDLFFLICLSVVFSSTNFLLFIVLSSLVILLLSLFLNQFKIVLNNKIPLAGFQALFLSILLFIEKFSNIPLRY